MKTNTRFVKTLLLAALLGIACRHAKTPEGEEAGAPEGHEGHDHEGHEGHEGHDHEGERSDLDRPLEELFSDACEHGIPTFECQECRYEVGVVKASPELFTGGLVKEITVEKRPIEEEILLTGALRFDERRLTHLSSAVEGVIRRVHVGSGAQVRAGQLLVELSSHELGEAQAEFIEARTHTLLGEKRLLRTQTLLGEGVSSERELLDARHEAEDAQVREEIALEKLLRLGMSRDDALKLRPELAKGLLQLRAPSAGTVLEMHATPGELASPNTPILSLGDSGSLWLVADLYEGELQRVRAALAAKSSSASVRVRAFDGEEFPAIVDFLAPTMNEGTRTASLRFNVPNADGRLLAGMFAEVSLRLPTGEPVAALPEGAILEDEGRKFIFVHHHDDFWVRRPVTLGRKAGAQVEILTGLVGGERVIHEGAFLFKSDVLRSKMGAGCAD